MTDQFEPKIPLFKNTAEGNRPLSEREQKIKNRIDALKSHRPVEQIDQILQEILDFSKRLEVEYPNNYDYPIFHAIIGSGMHPAHPNVIEEDFPGDYSVEKFVDYLENKYKA